MEHVIRAARLREAARRLADGAVVEREGFLEKRSPAAAHRWQRRFFVLKPGRLYYYDKQPAGGAAGPLKEPLLLAACIVERAEGDGAAFTLTPSASDRAYELRAASPEEATEWIEAIAASKGRLRRPKLRPRAQRQAAELGAPPTAAEKSAADAQGLEAAFARSTLLGLLPDAQRSALAAAVVSHSFAPGESVFAIGDDADDAFFVKSGTFELAAAGEPPTLVTVGAGECFGEAAILYSEARLFSARTEGGGEVWRVSRSVYVSVVRSSSQSKRMEFGLFLRRCAIFEKLPDPDLMRVVDAMEQVTVADGEVVIEEGDATHSFFYVIAAGSVRVTSGTSEVAVRGPGEYFGELSIVEEQKRTATVTAVGQTKLLRMDQQSFVRTLGCSASEIAFRKYETDKTVAESEPAPIMSLSDGDFNNVRVLGQGAFGIVTLARDKRDDEYVAKKQLSKFGVIDSLAEHPAAVENLFAERDIGFVCQGCRYLVSLLGAYQDAASVYMILELATGGELFNAIQDGVGNRGVSGCLSPAAARVLTVEVALALEHLQNAGFVYRDLKPENCLLIGSGHLKVADFGFVKQLQPGEKTFTYCGTEEYMSPEIIRGTGVDFSTDWWSLGILLFEMLTGASPFNDCLMDTDGYYGVDPVSYRIVKGLPKRDRVKKLKSSCFCARFLNSMPKDTVDLIYGLLELNPAKRLGSGATGAMEVLGHPYFSSVDIEAAKSGDGWDAPKGFVLKKSPLHQVSAKFPKIKAQKLQTGTLSEEQDAVFAGF